MIEKLASAIYNDIKSGLVGLSETPTISIEQLQDDVVDERLQIIKEYSLKNLIPRKDLLMAINCIEVDCMSLDKCPCATSYTQPKLHFEIPQFVNDLGAQSVDYIGAIDKSMQYKVYTSTSFIYHKYLRRGAEKPYVYIDTTPNSNNMYDCWVFNAPFIKKISASIIPKDPRQLDIYDCCNGEDVENITFLSAEIKKRLTEKKIRYYRQLYQGPQPNNQVAK